MRQIKNTENFLRFMASTLNTVSYTHLDVYKRQIYDYQKKS